MRGGGGKSKGRGRHHHQGPMSKNKKMLTPKPTPYPLQIKAATLNKKTVPIKPVVSPPSKPRKTKSGKGVAPAKPQEVFKQQHQINQ